MPQLISFFGAALSCTTDYWALTFRFSAEIMSETKRCIQSWHLDVKLDALAWTNAVNHCEDAEAAQELCFGGVVEELPQRSPVVPLPRSLMRISILPCESPFHCSGHHSHETTADARSKLRGQKAERGGMVQALCSKSKKSSGHPCSKHSSEQLWIQLGGS